uniref:Uncharacterized protein n=1 Tax=Siphoviridae sp. ctQtc11 TaxID=2825497 RepID=A0A8S5P5I1_9CAUD|nr:MAG TPA: hypothetical protein [Siphoviridae sp. ctQtc11]
MEYITSICPIYRTFIYTQNHINLISLHLVQLLFSQVD